MASDDPIRNYQAVLRELNQATTELEEMGTMLWKAGDLFHRAFWRINPVNAPSGIGYPASVATAREKIDLATWPSADEIAKKLADWHELLRRARNAWGAIPVEEREGLREPPNYPI